MEKLNNLKPLISRNEELYISKEAKKENALASVGKSWRTEKINMRVKSHIRTERDSPSHAFGIS